MRVEFRVLGDVEVLVGGRRVDVGHARQRDVLLALLVDANHVVPVDRLVERVWADRPPQGARGALYNYVSRLRRVLADGPDNTVVRRSGGYLLAVEALAVDLDLFDDLTARARATGDAEVAAGLFTQALALWRGEAFAGLDLPWLEGVRSAATDRRIAAELDRNDLELRRGRHRDLVPELSARAAARPLDERLAGQLMLALYRSGRQADALEHYRRTRSQLAEELGIDPGPALRDLHRQILAASPALGLAAPGQTRRAAPPPRQLPAPPRSFTGRQDQLAQLDAVARPAEVDVVAISGAAGVGKTALAVHWAHRVAAAFPDGQLYVNLRGFDPGGDAMDPAAAVRGFLHALGVSDDRVPLSLDAQAALYRSLLAGKRVLIVLDNARDSEQIRPLLPGTPGCVAVVTSRTQLAGLSVTHRARSLLLGLLSPADARDLLVRRLAGDRAAREPAVVTRIVDRCAGLPLALVIVAARAAYQPHLPLAALAAELDDAQPLDALQTGDPVTDIRAVFSWSYRALPPESARLFRLLGLHPGPDLALPAAASIAGLPPTRTRTLLAELVRTHLIHEHAAGRFAFHDLLRAYAGELANEADGEPEAVAATGRMFAHYVHTAHRAARLLNAGRDPLALPVPPAGTVRTELHDSGEATEWLAAEYPVLLAAVQRTVTTPGHHADAWPLAWSLVEFLDFRGRWPELLPALSAAARVSDRTLLPQIETTIGRFHLRLDRLSVAGEHARRAAELAARNGDPIERARAELQYGNILERQGLYREALEHARIALGLHQGTDSRMEAHALNAVGWYHAHLGEFDAALAHCEHANTVFVTIDDAPGQASTSDSLGFIHRGRGDRTRAVECYRTALAIYRRLSDRLYQAYTQANLAEAQAEDGDLDAARAGLREALAILSDLGHADAGRVAAKLRELESQRA
ncbi:AfsR/SARP family transcriptional regulator [Actinoplanes subtropicus]|uniref:AfsR/SARP family transcriptional regulator n=1 Tax=Actinoplanes subtropicus TaxID=543632 RepID=UPI0004C422ED|nr:BTAD domain-containing putative transcriptional regulator [Actinoplanes subtropicus]